MAGILLYFHEIFVRLFFVWLLKFSLLCLSCRWDFGDGSSKVIHNMSAPCQTMEGLMERGEKQVYVQDFVNYTYSIPGKHMHKLLKQH